MGGFSIVQISIDARIGHGSHVNGTEYHPQIYKLLQTLCLFLISEHKY